MMRHLERSHGLDVSISQVTCPLCLKYTSGDRDALSLHLARHMEEIALAILPSGVDSGTDSGTESGIDSDDSDQHGFVNYDASSSMFTDLYILNRA
jgi:hypothetical protein